MAPGVAACHHSPVMAVLKNPPWRDPMFYSALLAAPGLWGLWWLWRPTALDLAWPLRAPQPFLLLAIVYPVLEEIVFRGGLQPLLLRNRRLAQQRWGLSGANLVTSLIFAAFHLVAHAPLWAAAVLLPSLVFGYFRDRYHSLAAPIVLHVFYNAGYFWLFGR